MKKEITEFDKIKLDILKMQVKCLQLKCDNLNSHSHHSAITEMLAELKLTLKEIQKLEN
jgi:hypothetical protein